MVKIYWGIILRIKKRPIENAMSRLKKSMKGD